MKFKALLRILVGLASLAQLADAATIPDPTLSSGPGDIIDPTGSEDVDESFGTAQTTLEARSDLRVLQTFAGFVAGGNNVVSFTSSALPDIQFQLSGDFSPAASGNEGAGLNATSGTSAMLLRNSGTNLTSTLTISFGTWNGSTFTADQTVLAAGFTLAQLATAKSGTVTFRDSAGIALSGASFPYSGSGNLDIPGNHKDMYFGWDSTAESSSRIGSITITLGDTGLSTSGLDDFAFTVAPGDSSLALTGFTYDPATGDSEVSIEGEPDTAYILAEADDLDFGNPDQSPVPLTGATVGTLAGDQVTTDSTGEATVQFNLGAAKTATFVRAESAPPPPSLLSEDFEGE